MFESERLFLRPLELADAADVFSYRSDKETNKYQGFIPENMAELLAWMKKRPASFNEPNSWFQLSIISKESKELIGDVGIHFLKNKPQVCELGCTLKKKEHGKGFAREALKSVIKGLFTKWDKKEILVQLYPENKGSLKLVRSLGFEAYSASNTSQDEKLLHYRLINKGSASFG